MTTRPMRLVDSSSMWEWAASQPGFVAAQLAHPSFLTPLERWYFEARTIASQSSCCSSISPASTDDLDIDCFDMHYAQNLSAVDKHAQRAIYGRHRNRSAPVDECFWFKTMCKGQVRHVSCSRSSDETLVASDIRLDPSKCNDIATLLHGPFSALLVHIWKPESHRGTTQTTQ
ncbi:hypothetical protein H310_08946 [Aphanomyces invadans]|uniref:Uncharacterized protein n=1 Tax=Aphanomyces invadans TaxID=157072 RepID=A0A024TW20_9STRA|nr:hypothetical protein H310_08946 [Aphanomyces invadans]ETV98223.1 hypothetical protein H310_08946 [Aphanomyces invadans]|eukprot:XP_008873098.1 hypothetical protein H310_08946 [Aphanomyces invadans]